MQYRPHAVPGDSIVTSHLNDPSSKSDKSLNTKVKRNGNQLLVPCYS